MRIVAGQYRGQTISAGKDQSIRPTTNRIKTYIFDLLGNFVEQAAVLDLFSGAGSLGIEALSRGAESATFVDLSPRSLRISRQNVEKIGIKEQTTFIKSDALKYLQRNTKTYDIIFADPPYTWEKFDQLLSSVFEKQHLTRDGIVVLENEARHHIDWETQDYAVLRQKKFNHCYITLFLRKDQP